MKKLRDWFYTHTSTPFEWGKWDCALAASDWVETATGTNPCADIVGTYDTRTGAYETITSMGDTLVEATSSRLGESKHPRQGKTGDVVVYDGERGETLGVIYSSSIIAPGERGLVAIPKARLNIKAAWTIDI